MRLYEKISLGEKIPSELNNIPISGTKAVCQMGAAVCRSLGASKKPMIKMSKPKIPQDASPSPSLLSTLCKKQPQAYYSRFQVASSQKPH
ncbi:hypothetical protein L596_026205 [Steinernema carpocapsae]|uniref:Uncharacterized protein n=1 Tax=Steinernema carpocapsae TaxID=34508 RepID=A0A4U5M0N4_STECR|nr:hypothetical protein L596_026205 [Steinernema carpocapsae]